MKGGSKGGSKGVSLRGLNISIGPYANQWWGNAHPDDFGEQSVADLPVTLAKGKIGPLHGRHTKDL